MKECWRVRKILSRYADNEVNGADDLLINAHLKECPPCRKELSGLIRVKLFILGMERAAMPQDHLVCRLREKITRWQRAKKKFSLADMGNFARRLIPLPLAAVVLSLVFLALNSGQADRYLLEDQILSGAQVTTDTALRLVLGIQK
jgi:predicted anti-sigma-YlaC factor YlaD